MKDRDAEPLGVSSPPRASVPSSLRVFPSAFPALGLVVSGGHTSLYALRSWTELTRLGATIDDAVGEAYDKAAAILGLPYPGGPRLDVLASTPGANERAVDFPVSRLSPDSLDFSFSGLKTALLYAARGKPGPGGVFPRPASAMTEQDRTNLAASFQRAASRAVVVKLQRALERGDELAGGPFHSIVAGGGVTANSRLRRELAELAAARGLALVLPRPEHCTDNAAMIAGLAFHMHAAGLVADLTLEAVPTTAC